MSYFNVIIGFFDGTGTSDVSASRFYLPQTMTQFEGQKPVGGDLKTFCMGIPTIFTEEIGYNNVPNAHIGWITSIAQNGRDYKITYNLPSGIMPIPADRMAAALGISDRPSRGIGDMQHSHWTIKEGDLFQILQQAGAFENTQSSVFLKPPASSQPNLVSVMMPFAGQFTAVYEALKEAAGNLGYECIRADDIWEHSTVIQDIYSLIYRSKVVICDFSTKNPNVFYEAGIAHTLGRHVIPIVQHKDDVPFDLQHHRHVLYLNNKEGLEKLVAEISPRIDTLMKS